MLSPCTTAYADLSKGQQDESDSLGEEFSNTTTMQNKERIEAKYYLNMFQNTDEKISVKIQITFTSRLHRGPIQQGWLR